MFILLCISCVLFTSTNADAASKKKTVVNEDIGNDYNHYIRQELKQIDCQAIKIDERWTDGGKAHYKKICFYDMVIEKNKHIIMWNDVYHPEHYGFISNSPVD